MTRPAHRSEKLKLGFPRSANRNQALLPVGAFNRNAEMHNPVGGLGLLFLMSELDSEQPEIQSHGMCTLVQGLVALFWYPPSSFPLNP